MNEPELEHPTAEQAKSPLQTWRILFLDTEEHIEVLKELCKAEGYVVVGATSIEQAWAFLEGKNHADVIVCAAWLEGESLFELLAGVRASSGHATATVLILSLEPTETAAKLDRSTARAAIALGANAYLSMPHLDARMLITELQKLTPSMPLLQQASPEERRRSE